MKHLKTIINDKMAPIRRGIIQPKNDQLMRSISVDCVIFGLSEKKLKILIVKHATGRSKGEWGLPGGWINKKESLEDAANRVLSELTGMENLFLEQLRAFSDVNRTGNERILTFAFYALIRSEHHQLTLSAEALDAKWANVKSPPPLIFDHKHILSAGLEALRRKIRHEPIGVNLLPRKFTLGQLQELYELILDKKLDKPNFRRKMMRMNFLVRCNETQDNVPHRAGALYRFDAKVYRNLCNQGFSFEF